MQIVWAKAGRGIWGLGHVYEGKLYFTKDIVADFVPRNRKPKAIPKLEANPAPSPTQEGKHVQLFKMRSKVGKGFYSINYWPSHWPNGKFPRICVNFMKMATFWAMAVFTGVNSV